MIPLVDFLNGSNTGVCKYLSEDVFWSMCSPSTSEANGGGGSSNDRGVGGGGGCTQFLHGSRKDHCQNVAEGGRSIIAPIIEAIADWDDPSLVSLPKVPKKSCSGDGS